MYTCICFVGVYLYGLIVAAQIFRTKFRTLPLSTPSPVLRAESVMCGEFSDSDYFKRFVVVVVCTRQFNLGL